MKKKYFFILIALLGILFHFFDLKGEKGCSNISSFNYNQKSSLINLFPWYDGFESDFLSENWTQDTLAGDRQLWRIEGSVSSYLPNGWPVRGSKLLYLPGGSAENTTLLITPAFDFSEAEYPELSFVYNFQKYTDEKLSLLYRTSLEDDWNLLSTYSGTSDWNWVAISFHEFSGNNFTHLYI